MGKDRLTAFSDGVIAIVITIMVLELKVPHGADWTVLLGVAPSFVSYVLSFVYLGIYWNNHHHLLHTVTKVDGANPLDQFLLVVLAFSHPSRNSLDGRKLFSSNTHCGLWCDIADARHRLPPATKGDHAKARPEFCTCQCAWD
jgi:Endosomal/lysosomal potassium channel TMEM175